MVDLIRISVGVVGDFEFPVPTVVAFSFRDYRYTSNTTELLLSVRVCAVLLIFSGLLASPPSSDRCAGCCDAEVLVVDGGGFDCVFVLPQVSWCCLFNDGIFGSLLRSQFALNNVHTHTTHDNPQSNIQPPQQQQNTRQQHGCIALLRQHPDQCITRRARHRMTWLKVVCVYRGAHLIYLDGVAI